ncbi:type IV fimbrial biogenesis protein FimT [Colwellia chukchiensis]|uniref:Type II secretion system protein H n=1 Tax=Colwellia chukchiensis TaxID=641665 RepID=A0A1H7FVH8_9GAMM|nr:GspH/FimT family protein [Colwellia chukchiensis]SEK29938.1 type IV fimbrial biogenesis protein FimT [Colwellia chukchiensis]
MAKYAGFTIIEVLVALAILLSLLAIGIPSLNSFLVNIRVDNEIYSLHRLILTARNSALTKNTRVTLCPLNSQGECKNLWHNELSVFTDSNNNKKYEPALNEQLVAQKAAIKVGDKLQYGKTRIGLTYAATGHLSGWGQNATFSYCPADHSSKSRGIIVHTSGRAYVSENHKNKGDRKRTGAKIKCY